MAALIDMHFDSASKAETQRDAVVHHGRDQTRSDALMLLAHRIAQYDRRGGEAHVHTERRNEAAHERLGPIGLVYRHRGQDDGPHGEPYQGDRHRPRGADLAEDEAGHDCSYDSADHHWREVRRCEDRRSVPQDFEKLDNVVYPDAEAGPSTCHSGEDEPDVSGETFEWDEG